MQWIDSHICLQARCFVSVWLTDDPAQGVAALVHLALLLSLRVSDRANTTSQLHIRRSEGFGMFWLNPKV